MGDSMLTNTGVLDDCGTLFYVSVAALVDLAMPFQENSEIPQNWTKLGNDWWLKK
jgi:hypothetical protein